MSFRRSQRETCTTRGSSGEKGLCAPHHRRYPRRPWAPDQPDPGQEAGDPPRGQRAVLVRERVDGGFNDPHVGASKPGGHEGGMGEDEGAALGEVRMEEAPRLFGERVRAVRPDVAAPGDVYPVADQVVRQTRCLGVVEEDDVVAMRSARRSHPRWRPGRPRSVPPPGARGPRRRRLRRECGCAAAW